MRVVAMVMPGPNVSGHFGEPVDLGSWSPAASAQLRRFLRLGALHACSPGDYLSPTDEWSTNPSATDASTTCTETDGPCTLKRAIGRSTT